MRGIAGAGTAATDTGIAAATGVAGYNPTSFTDADISKYMSPYTQQVTDVQKQQANQDYQEQQAGRDASAVQAGAFGGDRRFVSDSLAQRDLNNQLQGIEATGLQNAYTSGANLFQQDQTNNLNAANTRLDAANTLGQLDTSKQNLGLTSAQALSAVGAKTQQQQQAGLDIAHQDFLDQQNWPNQQLSLYSQLLSGTPVSANTSTTTTAPAPDFLSQLLGLGTSAAGWASLLGTGA